MKIYYPIIGVLIIFLIFMLPVFFIPLATKTSFTIYEMHNLCNGLEIFASIQGDYTCRYAEFIFYGGLAAVVIIFVIFFIDFIKEEKNEKNEIIPIKMKEKIDNKLKEIDSKKPKYELVDKSKLKEIDAKYPYEPIDLKGKKKSK